MCSITGSPGTDFLGNPIMIANSLLLNNEVGSISTLVLSKGLSYKNNG